MSDFIDWPNEDYTPTVTGRESRQAGSRHRKILRDMATKIRDERKAATSYLPTEKDSKGRVALYLLKYLNEWIDIEELAHPLIGGSAVESRLNELEQAEGWPIRFVLKDGGIDSAKLTEDPRKPLWSATK
jgi:hypothetical protein